jgi:curli biogenesis system outer membrane secretion channel CsgG
MKKLVSSEKSLFAKIILYMSMMAPFIATPVMFTFASTSSNASKSSGKGVRVAISTLDDKTGTGECHSNWFWDNNIGTGFRAQLATELAKYKDLSIQERENLRTMHEEEHELINADESALPKKKKFKAAQYSITGAVTEFEYCAGKRQGKLNVGAFFGQPDLGVEIGGRKSSAKVAMDIRVIDVETGAVVDSFRAVGKAKRTGLNVDINYREVEFGSSGYDNTPLGAATRESLRDAAAKIHRVVIR